MLARRWTLRYMQVSSRTWLNPRDLHALRRVHLKRGVVIELRTVSTGRWLSRLWEGSGPWPINRWQGRIATPSLRWTLRFSSRNCSPWLGHDVKWFFNGSSSMRAAGPRTRSLVEVGEAGRDRSTSTLTSSWTLYIFYSGSLSILRKRLSLCILLVGLKQHD